jgi:hypothetical protein
MDQVLEKIAVPPSAREFPTDSILNVMKVHYIIYKVCHWLLNRTRINPIHAGPSKHPQLPVNTALNPRRLESSAIPL